MKKWKYLVINNRYLDEDDLNEIGKNGWELISYKKTIFSHIMEVIYEYIFKK